MSQLVTPFSSAEGLAKFLSKSAVIKGRLLESFTPQENPYYCGMASILMVLKATEKPSEKWLTIENLFTSEFKKIRRKEQILNQVPGDYPGLALEDIHQIFQLYFQSAELHFAAEVPEDILFKKIQDAFSKIDAQVIVNFDGTSLGLDSEGHSGVVAAIDSSTMEILVLDPASHKRGWFWVSFNELFKSMLKLREPRMKSRGIIVVSERNEK